MTILLIAASIINAFRLFTRTRMYQLTLATDPVASPHAKFVQRDQASDHQVAHSSSAGVGNAISHLWHAFAVSVRFLLNMAPPKDRQMAANRTERVQQLEVWTPGELETALFAIYSPVHTLLWMALTGANWIMMTFIMGIVSVHVRTSRLLLRDTRWLNAS